MKIRKLFALSLLVTSMAEARINETVEQCEKRYGKALIKKGKMHVYEKAGLRIGVIFHNGVSHSIAYWKAEKDAIEQPLKLSDKEVEVLLNSNKTNSEWKEIEANRMQTLWYTKDDKLIALNSKIDRRLTIMTEEYRLFKQKAAEKKEAENLKGF